MPKLIQFSPQEEQALGFTHKLVLNYADVAAMTSGTAYSFFPYRNPTTQTLAMETAAAATTGGRTVAAGVRVTNSAVRVTTAFASAADTITLVLISGDGGDTARYAPSTTLKTAAYFASTLKMPFLYVAADTIDITITAGVEAITVLTAGEVEIYLGIQDLAALNRPTTLANS